MTMLAKFEVSCLVGTHTLLYTEIQESENESFKFNPVLEKLDVGDRIVQLVDDKTHAFGMQLMTDSGPRGQDYVQHFESKLYTFPLRQSLAKSPKLQL